MANPQRENGHTQIANELLEALCSFGLGGREFAIVLMVARLTYGWQKKTHSVTINEVALRLRKQYENTRKGVRSLLDSNILVETEDGLAIQKDYEKWTQPDKSTLHSDPIKRPAKMSGQPAKMSGSTGPRAASDAGSQAPKETSSHVESNNTTELDTARAILAEAVAPWKGLRVETVVRDFEGTMARRVKDFKPELMAWLKLGPVEKAEWIQRALALPKTRESDSPIGYAAGAILGCLRDGSVLAPVVTRTAVTPPTGPELSPFEKWLSEAGHRQGGGPREWAVHWEAERLNQMRGTSLDPMRAFEICQRDGYEAAMRWIWDDGHRQLAQMKERKDASA